MLDLLYEVDDRKLTNDIMKATCGLPVRDLYTCAMDLWPSYMPTQAHAVCLPQPSLAITREDRNFVLRFRPKVMSIDHYKYNPISQKG